MSYHMSTDVPSSQTERELERCFELWGVRDYQIDFNVMRSRHRSHSLSQNERGVTVSWVDPRSKREVTLSMNNHPRPQDNIRVLYLAIDAMRLNEKRGIGEAMKSAYLQLDAGGDDNWWTLLGLPHPNVTPEEVDRQYRVLAKEAHPDQGGSDEAMAKVNRARDEAYMALGSAGVR